MNSKHKPHAFQVQEVLSLYLKRERQKKRRLEEREMLAFLRNQNIKDVTLKAIKEARGEFLARLDEKKIMKANKINVLKELPAVVLPTSDAAVTHRMETYQELVDYALKLRAEDDALLKAEKSIWRQILNFLRWFFTGRKS